MAVDTGTGTQKQHRAMVDLVERKIRLRAHQLYEERGHVGGFALEDWLNAESEVLKTSILAPLYRSRNGEQATSMMGSTRNIAGAQLPHMDRLSNEADYVLENLCRARQEVIAHPEWFDPDAVERIDKAIASIQEERLGVKAA